MSDETWFPVKMLSTFNDSLLFVDCELVQVLQECLVALVHAMGLCRVAEMTAEVVLNRLQVQMSNECLPHTYFARVSSAREVVRIASWLSQGQDFERVHQVLQETHEPFDLCSLIHPVSGELRCQGSLRL
jgi:hypothetical protein